MSSPASEAFAPSFSDILATNNSDERLIREIASQSRDALGRLYDRHAPLAYAIAQRIVGTNDAPDVIEDVFAQVWRDAAQFTPGRGPVATWILTLTRTASLKGIRATRARTS